jgi:hypothetical protein
MPAQGSSRKLPDDSLIDPEDDGCGDGDGRHEGGCTSVVAGMDASPVLELAEHVLDFVAVAIERFVERRLDTFCNRSTVSPVFDGAIIVCGFHASVRGRHIERHILGETIVGLNAASSKT